MKGKHLALLVAGTWLAVRAYRSVHRYDFRGKTVLITGGSRGLGLVLARQAAHEGARVAICARDPAELQRAEADLAERGARVLPVPCDLRDNIQVRLLVDTVRDQFGPIDVLINNAGIIGVGPVETMTLDDFQEAMQTNYWSAVCATLAVLPEMRRRGTGRIVNITSIGGKVSVPHLLPYDASKFALVGFSEGLRAEAARDGIVVTTVVPGLMRTGSPRNAEFKGQHRAEYTWFAISDALPFFSTSAENAASQILAACQRGDAEVVLTIPAKLAVAFHGLFPGLTSDLLGLANRLLPGPGGIHMERVKGKDSQTALSTSILTTLSDQAAERNNEIPPGDRTPAEETAPGLGR